MSTKQVQVEKTRPGRPGAYWILPLLRAVPALAAGFTITFVQDHSARFGLVVFAFFALATGIIVGVSSMRVIDDRATRSIFIIHGVVGALIGAGALAVVNGAAVTESALSEFLLLVTVFAAITGFLELYAGLRAKNSALGRDWLTVGALTAFAALIFLIIPPDAVLATGLFGAYGILIGTYLVIAGVSLRSAPQHPDRSSAAPHAPEPKAEES